MRKFTLFKNLVVMYTEDKTTTVILAGEIVEGPGTAPLTGIIQVLHNGRMMRVFANDFQDSVKPDDSTREESD